MASSSALSAAGLDICNLRQIVRLDIAASNELQKRIDQVRYELKGGKRLPEETVQAMENLSKDMTKDLVNRIESIERSGPLKAADREMLQDLSARLAVRDCQGMQLAELRDLEKELSRERETARTVDESLPLGGTPRKPSNISALYTPEGSPPAAFNIPPPPPYSAQQSPPNQPDIPTFAPPPTSSPRSSNPSLERVSSQRRQRRSCEIRRDHIYPSYSPPKGTNTPPLPSPRDQNLTHQTPTPQVSTSTSAHPYHHHHHHQTLATNVKRNASFPSTLTTPTTSSIHPPHPTPRRDSAKAHHGEYQFYSYADYSDSESDSSLPTSHETKSSWPLLYRILDIDPSTDPDVLLLVAKRKLERLSLRHNPARVGRGDSGAERRWEAINTAYDILTHPERKLMYDAGAGEPIEALGVNLEELRL